MSEFWGYAYWIPNDRSGKSERTRAKVSAGWSKFNGTRKCQRFASVNCPTSCSFPPRTARHKMTCLCWRDVKHLFIYNCTSTVYHFGHVIELRNSRDIQLYNGERGFIQRMRYTVSMKVARSHKTETETDAICISAVYSRKYGCTSQNVFGREKWCGIMANAARHWWKKIEFRYWSWQAQQADR